MMVPNDRDQTSYGSWDDDLEILPEREAEPDPKDMPTFKRIHSEKQEYTPVIVPTSSQPPIPKSQGERE